MVLMFIRIIGISPDDSEKHKKFCDKMGIKYTEIESFLEQNTHFGEKS